ncbi:AlpA family phage regulatory protein [Escherichia coli]|nr:AlpA family phage regulatory protein [Escherichia coli]
MANYNSLIRLSEVQRRTGYSKAWIYRLISQGRFPKQVKIGSRAIAFVDHPPICCALMSAALASG